MAKKKTTKKSTQETGITDKLVRPMFALGIMLVFLFTFFLQ